MSTVWDPQIKAAVAQPVIGEPRRFCSLFSFFICSLGEKSSFGLSAETSLWRREARNLEMLSSVWVSTLYSSTLCPCLDLRARKTARDSVQGFLKINDPLVCTDYLTQNWCAFAWGKWNMASQHFLQFCTVALIAVKAWLIHFGWFLILRILILRSSFCFYFLSFQVLKNSLPEYFQLILAYQLWLF